LNFCDINFEAQGLGVNNETEVLAEMAMAEGYYGLCSFTAVAGGSWFWRLFGLHGFPGY
jgi:hypothetical protein